MIVNIEKIDICLLCLKLCHEVDTDIQIGDLIERDIKNASMLLYLPKRENINQKSNLDKN